MKYVNQINIVLVAVAVAAVALAFSQTYLSSEPPPAYVVSPSTPQPTPVESRNEEEAQQTAAPSPASLTAPRAAETGSSRVEPANDRVPAGPRPSLGHGLASPTNSAVRQPARQVDTRRPQTPLAPAPVSREAQRRGPGSRPIPQDVDEDQDSEPAPAQNSSSRRPEVRRDQNRRVNPAPPPARSSMPEQRPQR